MRCATYVINLDRSTDRIEFMLGQAGRLGIGLCRVAGVDGRAPAPADRETYGRELAASRLSPGETGCLLSHHKAWQAIRDSGDPWGVVLEDDVILSPDYPAVIAGLDRVPADADIIRLEAQPHVRIKLARGTARLGNRRLRRLNGPAALAGAYAASRRFCERQLMKPLPLDLPADLFLFDPRSSIFTTTVTYVLVPALAIQTLLVPAASGLPFMKSVIAPERARDRHAPAAAPPAKLWKRRDMRKTVQREFQRLVRQAHGLFAASGTDKPVEFR